MGNLFHGLTEEKRAELMQWYSDTFKTLLDVPINEFDVRYKVTADDYEEDHIAEINREMSLPPRSHKKGGLI